VTLKSLRTISGLGRCFSLLVLSTSSQNGSCSALLVGMYTFSSEVSQVSSHFSLIIRAQPGYMSWMEVSLRSKRVLFITKATPAWPLGSFESSDIIISRFLLKQLQTLSVLSRSRCVS
jgi:hypothetical protein